MKIWFAIAGAAVTAIVLVATTGAVSSKTPTSSKSGPVALHGKHISNSALMRYWRNHSSAAPSQLQTGLSSLHGVKTSSKSTAHRAAPPGLLDFSGVQGTGYPQSGSALAECTNTGSAAQYLVGSANDYAGEFGIDANVSDFSYSNDGGTSFTKGGRFGNVTFSDSMSVPTSGNPSVVSTQTAPTDAACLFWLSGQALSDDGTHSGVFVARTSADTLNGPCSTADTCFPIKKLVVQSIDGSGNTLHDSPDLAVGISSSTHTRGFALADTLLTATASQIELTLCNGTLSSCGTAPVDTSTDSSSGNFVQFPSVSFTPAGNVAVVWAFYNYGAGDAQGLDGLTVELRETTCAPASATTFSCGPVNVVTRETAPLSDATSSLKDASFQVETAPRVNAIGTTRLYVVWNACGDNGSTNDAFGRCDDSQVRFSYSGDGGSTWSAPAAVASGPGDQLQPSKPQLAGGKVAVGYYSTGDALALTGRNVGYDEYLASAVYSGSPITFASTRVTSSPTWPAADWWGLAEQSIGDTQGLATTGLSSSTVWLDFTANYDDECIASDIYSCSIRPASQQDTFLAKTTTP